MRSSAYPVRAVVRLLLTLSFVVVVSSVASAYTIVMLGGRQIQIPDQFSVTQTTLTYRVGDTISATILMAAIDVSATERANNEAPGSLLKRAVDRRDLSEQRSSSERLGGSQERRTITNKNLERFAEARRASEVAYEKRRIELGLPSLEESRRKAAEDEESLTQLLVETRAREQQTAQYWQARATELISDLAVLDEQINFIRVRLGETPVNLGVGSLVIGNGAFSGTAHSRTSPSLNANFGRRASTFLAPSVRGQFGSEAGTARGRVFSNPMDRRAGGRGFALPGPVASLFISSSSDFAYEVSTLMVELDRLLAIRAGLEASQRQLAEEARRAGVDPGWLRP